MEQNEKMNPAEEQTKDKRVKKPSDVQPSRVETTPAGKLRQVERMELRRQREENEIQAIESSALLTAANARQILKGVVVGVYPIGKDTQKTVIVNVRYRDAFIAIPYDEMYIKDPFNAEGMDLTAAENVDLKIRRQKKIIEKMIGADCQFVITKFIPGDNGEPDQIIGSRKQALYALNEFYFGGDNPRYQKGDDVVCYVTNVSVHALVVQVAGVDTVIKQYHLTGRWCMDLHELYKVGDTVTARIMEVFKNDRGDYTLMLNHKAIELDDAKRAQPYMPVGMVTQGIITSASRKKSASGSTYWVFTAWIPNYEVPARISRVNPLDAERGLRPGDKVRLTVRGYDDDGKIQCTILSELGTSGSFSRLVGLR